MEKKKIKTNFTNSRKQFLIKLQLEYLTHKLRAHIYKEESYAKVSRDIANKKKVKIMELSVKFNMKTIFNSVENCRQFLHKYFWNQTGTPNFQYKNDEQKRVQGNYDRWYLFFRDTSVIFNGIGAKVLSNDPSNKSLKIILQTGEKLQVNYDDIVLDYDVLNKIMTAF